MKLARRNFFPLVAGAAALATLSRRARAQSYPSKPVRLIDPYAAGGGSDLVARLVGRWLSERLGQPVIVDNRPGAGTNLATQMVVSAPADGLTLLLAVAASAINATLYTGLSFNFIRDIAPIAGITRQPFVMTVSPSVPATTVPQFIAYAKANRGKLNMASAGIGSGPHVAGELFKMLAGVEMTHVPYRGGGPALTDLLGGQVQVYFGSVGVSVEHIRTGGLRALAVTTAARSPLLPDIPALGNFLPGYEASFWAGIGAPRNTPPEIIDRLNREINAGLADPKVKARLAELGGETIVGSPADFGKLVVDETEKWAKVVKFCGATAA